ncbi:MAG: pyrroline-5-carboxylate reductase [Betaproteobacteria bacterium]|nr:pyrroline-5-carboxylate reductase [Betaproteobacteria bacterium]
MKITFIGGGNMTTALIGGLRKQGYSAAAMQVVEPLEENREKLTGVFGVRCCAAVDAASLNCEMLVLAIKPQQARAALAPLTNQFKGLLQEQLVVSVIAGLRLTDISRWLGGYRKLVRSMPNMPALIGAGISGLYANPEVDHEGRDTAEKILKAVGHTLWITDEAQMDAVTAISGSGPAYVFYFIEALQQSAQVLGFDEATARKLAIETFVGAARMAEQSQESFSELRHRVTSKGGTTEAALNSFESDGVAAAIMRGAHAAAARGRALGDEMGRD